jgi:hypothetical protein
MRKWRRRVASVTRRGRCSKASPASTGSLQASHRKGKLGEIAVEKYAVSQGPDVEPVLRDIAQTNREDLGPVAEFNPA